MKKSFFLYLLMLPLIFSCKKVITPIIEKTTEANLVDKAWLMDEITFVQSNQLYYYQRGGQSNTAHFDNNTIYFKKDKTGTYSDGGHIYDITWSFDQDDKTKLQYTIYDYQNGAPQEGVNSVVYLENVNVSDAYFRYAEIYTHDGEKSVISSVKRVYLDIK